MRATTAARLVMVLAAVGLLVSVSTAWSRLAAGPPDQVDEPARPVVASQARRIDGEAGRARAVVPEAGRAPMVVRKDATRLREATRPVLTGRPEQARLASIGITADVRPVGVQKDGQMRLPPDPEILGWYRFGAAPGAGRGSTVLAGHLDSQRRGLGPLVRLRDIEIGDIVRVAVAGGTVVRYAVHSIRRYDRQGLPPGLFSRTGPERLQVITCGGAYDPSRGGYQQNLVVTAVPVG